jgi:hypothetical protein
MQYSRVELELADNLGTLAWSATVAFSAAPIRYPLLGNAGCLEFLDATFFGERRVVELQANSSFPGTLP